MDDSKVFVGLDYHQASVQVCVMEHRGEVLLNKSGPNDAGAIIEAVALRTTPMFTDNWAMPTTAKSTATLGA